MNQQTWYSTGPGGTFTWSGYAQGGPIPFTPPRPRSTGPYLVLGLPDGANAIAIRSAFRRLAKKHHPDKGGDLTKMKTINAAYTTLKERGLV